MDGDRCIIKYTICLHHFAYFCFSTFYSSLGFGDPDLLFIFHAGNSNSLEIKT